MRPGAAGHRFSLSEKTFEANENIPHNLDLAGQRHGSTRQLYNEPPFPRTQQVLVSFRALGDSSDSRNRPGIPGFAIREVGEYRVFYNRLRSDVRMEHFLDSHRLQDDFDTTRCRWRYIFCVQRVVGASANFAPTRPRLYALTAENPFFFPNPLCGLFRRLSWLGRRSHRERGSRNPTTEASSPLAVTPPAPGKPGCRRSWAAQTWMATFYLLEPCTRGLRLDIRTSHNRE